MTVRAVSFSSADYREPFQGGPGTTVLAAALGGVTIPDPDLPAVCGCIHGGLWQGDLASRAKSVTNSGAGGRGDELTSVLF